jgi:hypothetical protein
LILCKLTPSASRLILFELQFQLKLLDLGLELEIKFLGGVELGLKFLQLRGLFRLPLMVLGFIVGLESLDFFAEALLEGMNFFFERFYFVLIMSIIIITPVTSRTVALSTPTRVHASLLSELVC